MRNEETTRATIKRVNHTGISVRDIDRSLMFYESLLGMELIFDSDLDDVQALNEVVGMDKARGRVVWLRAGDTMIELWQWDYLLMQQILEDVVNKFLKTRRDY